MFVVWWSSKCHTALNCYTLSISLDVLNLIILCKHKSMHLFGRLTCVTISWAESRPSHHWPVPVSSPSKPSSTFQVSDRRNWRKLTEPLPTAQEPCCVCLRLVMLHKLTHGRGSNCFISERWNCFKKIDRLQIAASNESNEAHGWPNHFVMKLPSLYFIGL